jgi:NAD(P)-dependent dehydrogenase (short-subunit alcohol dehydrogenase family)
MPHNGAALLPFAARGTAADRVALVSGGNRGLGLEVVRLLAGLGMRVVLGSRSVEHGRAALERLGPGADRVAVRQLDVADAVSVARVVAWLGRRLGRCDVLMNNAGVLVDDDQDAARIDLDVVRHTLETNLFGTWRLSQAVAPLMRRRRYGRIVNVSSGLASLETMRRGLPAYRVSKCSVNALTRVLADELRDDGILVNACCPGLAQADPPGGDYGLASASADTPVWLATLADDGPTGGFWRDRRPIPW